MQQRRRHRKAERGVGGVQLLYPRGFWSGLSLPGVLWIAALFLVPFYAIVAQAAGGIDPIFGNSIPEWNPLYWQPENFRWAFQDPERVIWPTFVRTLGYVLSAVAATVVLGYPVAYYMSRLTGRSRNIFLLLMILPFWMSYLMRILSWVNLLQDDGLVNRVLSLTGFIEPQNWLSGRGSTVVMGLIYGYIPFFILPLYASLERIEKNLVQAALDLGASPARTFVRVTLPLSRPGLLAGIAIIMLPMFGDFFTASVLGTQRNAMVGSIVALYLTEFTHGASQGRGAALVIMLALLVSVLTLYYLIATARASRESQR
jgi:putrescine transport system permease protein